MEIKEFTVSYIYKGIKCFSFWGDRMKDAVDQFNRIAEKKGDYEEVTNIELSVRIES